jgi:hypothetical protein
MQTNQLDTSEFADFLASPETKMLQTLDFGSTRAHIAEHNGLDVIVMADLSGSAMVVYPCHAFDAESGGSIHDHARAIAANA